MDPGFRRDDNGNSEPVRDTFQPCVYILASRKCGTLYVGATSNLLQRLHRHRQGLIPGFTRRYGVRHLVHYEVLEMMEAAANRERQIKDWRRAWKIELIERRNLTWDDLAVGLGFAPPSPRDHGPRLAPG